MNSDTAQRKKPELTT